MATPANMPRQRATLTARPRTEHLLVTTQIEFVYGGWEEFACTCGVDFDQDVDAAQKHLAEARTAEKGTSLLRT